MDTDQRKRGYRSKNINYCGYRSGKAWVEIRESVGTDQRTYILVGTDQRKGGFISENMYY